MATRKVGFAKYLDKANLYGEDLHDALNKAFSCGDFSHPEHEWISKARESAAQANTYLQVATILYNNEVSKNER